MKILIPTAKEMNHNIKHYDFLEKLNQNTIKIIDEFANKSPEELAKIYKVKSEKAKIEYKHWQDLKKRRSSFYPALELFNGLMYRNIARDSFDDSDIEYIKENVLITTALCGIINPYDFIPAHRLDFLQKVVVENKTLKFLWRDNFDSHVKDQSLVISLLSNEFEEVFSKSIRDDFIKIIFAEEKNGELKIHSTISKKARGKFLTKLIKEKVENIEQLKGITFDNYSYNGSLSEDKKLVFIAR
ncbi:peroxide stress protein YaaA [Gemella bergeri]